jgi:predicted polyphosphate/ATP-dependent NAD kinase
MGAQVLEACDFAATVLDLNVADPTTPDDTAAAARALADDGCDLLLFVGGDGTANDVFRAVGNRLAVLGVPSGVKMRSGVFAASPEIAGDLANEFLQRASRPTRSADVLDLSDDNKTEIHLGVALVPEVTDGRLTGAKVSTSRGSRSERAALCRAVARELEPSTLYLFGPGSTTGDVLREVGISGTPLGVDAVCGGRLLGSDLSERSILELLAAHNRVRVVLGVIGGHVLIVSGVDKLLQLNPSVLWVDVADDVAAWLTGYQRVRVAPRRTVVMRVAGRN